MGGYYKANSKELKSFLVGVFSNDKGKLKVDFSAITNFCILDNKVLSFGKVSSGLNFEELEIIDKTFRGAGISKKEFEMKTEGKLTFGKDIPEVWVEPEKSLVFEVSLVEYFFTFYIFFFPDSCNRINKM